MVCFYPKQCTDISNRVERDGNTLLLSGTCIYSGKTYQAGLKALLGDLMSDRFKPSRLAGSFFLLYLPAKGEPRFWSDYSSIQNIYFHSDSGIISSSLLATIIGAASASGRLRLNRSALTEILTTGSLVGPDTIAEGVSRYEPVLHCDLPGIKRFDSRVEIADTTVAGSRSEEVERQLEVLRDYFRSVAPALNELGVLSGLTGGFDSRLIYFLLREVVSDYTLYTTSRARPTTEEAVAHSVSAFFGDKLCRPRHSTFRDIDSDLYRSLLHDNFLFNDGHIRTNQLWTEEIKSREYLKLLYGGARIGISGVGGEQYRNSYYLAGSSYNAYNWFFYENIFRHCGDPFSGDKARFEMVRYTLGKIMLLLGKENHTERITREEIKRYYDEVYNPANRTLRNNIENQLFFFLAPFTDFRVSAIARVSLPHLGANHDFERLMLNRLAPEAAHIWLDYGYPPGARVPLKFRALPLIKKAVGLRIYHSYYRKIRASGKLLIEIRESHPFVNEYLDRVKALSLPLHTGVLEKSDLLSPLLIEAGLLITRMTPYID